MAVKQCNK